MSPELLVRNYKRAANFMLNRMNNLLIVIETCSIVGSESRYRLDGPGIESRCGHDFRQPSRLSLRPIQPPVQRVPSVFPRGKTFVAWHWPSTLSITEVKERVELFFCFTSRVTSNVLGWSLIETYSFQWGFTI